MIDTKTPLVPIRMSAKAPTPARTHVKVLQHEIVMDEPESRHGTDLGPTPLDTLVAALAGCTNVVLDETVVRHAADAETLAGLRDGVSIALDHLANLPRRAERQ